MSNSTPVLIEVDNLSTYLGGKWIHRHLDLQVLQGEILGIAGGSGSGKTTLMRRILMLDSITDGMVRIFGRDIATCSDVQADKIRSRWGVTFQQGALFSSLSVLQNVMYPIREFTKLPISAVRELAMLKLVLTGLPTDAATKLPAELSGGMQKRAAFARAIALDPSVLFLDEPTAGLDPHSAGAIDELVLHLRETLGLTVVLITHDLETLKRVPDRVAFLGDKKVLMAMPMAELEQQKHPEILAYFSEVRR